MGSREDALHALEDRDWSSAEVEHAPRPAMVVHSIRLPDDASRWVEQEATRQGTNPSVVIRGLVERAARAETAGETVVVRVDELRRNVLRAVEQAIHPAA